MGRSQKININRSFEEGDSKPYGWLRGWRFQWKEVTADVVETARELELEVEPEDVTELLQSHDKTWTNKEFLLMDE